jgi:tetratricopeptide (TPR) repeat protein
MAVAAAAATREADDDAVFRQRAIELKDEGNDLYTSRKFKEALAKYEQALNLLPARDAVRAMVHSNRAACYLNMQCFADVVSEATSALKVDQRFNKALFHRANAYAALGQPAKAKRDLQGALEHDPNYADAKELLDALNGVQKPSAPAGLGGMNLERAKKEKSDKKGSAGSSAQAAQAQAQAEAAQLQAEAEAQAAQSQSRGPLIQIKASFGDDIRMFQVYSSISQRDLVTSIANKFAFVGQFSIKYEDLQGNMKNIQTRDDFQTAIYTTSARLQEMEKVPLIPYVELVCAPLPKIEDISLVDEEGKHAGIAPNEIVEIDEWILDFASLFREHLGIDAEGHLDPHAEVRFAFFLKLLFMRLYATGTLIHEAMTIKKLLLLSDFGDVQFANVFRSYRELLCWELFYRCDTQTRTP